MSSEVLVRIVMADNNPGRAAYTVTRLLESVMVEHALGREILDTPDVVYARRQREVER